MIKLYRNMEQPQKWIAYSPETGWVAFPMTDHGWEQRQPARGLDPLHLREVSPEQAVNTGLPRSAPHRRTFAKVA